MTNKKKTKLIKAQKQSTKKTKATKQTTTVRFPKKLLKPVSVFLTARLKKLEKRKKGIDSEDPFKNTARITDNASPDADAEEQFGHARTSALKGQLDRKMVQTKKALTRIKVGKYGICEDCGEMIDTDRLIIFPEATICVKCETDREK